MAKRYVLKGKKVKEQFKQFLESHYADALKGVGSSSSKPKSEEKPKKEKEPTKKNEECEDNETKDTNKNDKSVKKESKCMKKESKDAGGVKGSKLVCGLMDILSGCNIEEEKMCEITKHLKECGVPEKLYSKK